MAGVNVKMGVTGVSAFKKGMQDSESAVKALTSALKLNEKQLEATGNKELYMSNQAAILKDAIEAQKRVVSDASAALESMKKNGVSETSKAFNDMKKKVYDSTAKLLDLRTELKNVETQSGNTNTGLEGIGKNVAWDNVAEGLGKITDRMQSAARAAVNLGKKIARSVMSSADWADELKTSADKWDISVEQLQRMENVADMIDTDVDAILTAQQKMRKAATTKGGKETIEETLGISLDGQNADDLFWEIGDALINMGDSFDKEAAAQNVFGRSWRDLLPLFKAGREEYENMLDAQNVMSEEDVNKLGQVDDAIQNIKNEIELMKNQFIADNAETILNMMNWIVDNQGAVVAALTAIAGGFGALKLAEVAANVMKVVSGFESLGWIKSGGAAASAAKTAVSGGAKVLAAGAGGVAAPLAVMGAAGYAGAKLIEANLKDENLNKVYGNGGEGDIIDTMSQATAALVASYFKQYGSGTEESYAAREALQRAFEAEGIDLSEQAVQLIENIFDNYAKEVDPDGLVEKLSLLHPEVFGEGGEGLEIPAVLDPNLQALQEQLNVAGLTVPVTPYPNGSGTPHANGLPWVPFDGYPAILHKGERVMTAGENRNYSSNLYIENMNMHNGMDAQALAAALSAQNRRAAAGFGS